MTEQEKHIIETILVDVGLEPLHAVTNDQEPKIEPVKWLKQWARGGYSGC